MKKVLIFGSFDGFHPGHEFFIQQAQAYGSVTISLPDDQTIQVLKGALPKYTFEVRKKQIQNKFPLVQIVMSDVDGSWNIIQTVQPDMFVLGYDQTQLHAELQKYLKENNLNIPIHTTPAFKPDQYKSSILNAK